MHTTAENFRALAALAAALAWATTHTGCVALSRRSNPNNVAVAHAVGRMYKALVRIQVVMEEPRSGRLEKRVGAGSGAIISAAGHIISNHHVAGRAKRLICRMYDGEEVDAQLVASDPLTDLAIIQLDLSKRKNKEPLQVARFGDSDRLRVGDTVLAMGCPAAVSQSVTKGIVSNTQLIIPSSPGDIFQFREEGEPVGSVVRWIGHDAVIYPGNSGGPLVNPAGEIVGINEIGFGSLGGAIPSSLARDVAEQLIRQGRVERSWTGFEGQARPKNLGVERGVLVGGVLPDSPAAAAGLRAGDVVTAYDGVAVDAKIPEDLPAFNRLLLATPVGKKVPLIVLRAGQPLTCALVTRMRGKAWGDDSEFKDWGMVARNLTVIAAIERQRPSTNGVLVVSVGLGSPVSEARPAIAEGDILLEVAGRPVPTVAALEAVTRTALQNHEGLQPVLVKFDRGKMRYLTVAKIGKEKKRPDVEPARKPGLPAELQALSPELAEALKLKGRSGALVAFVYPGHSAEKAGLRQGDILVKFDGEPVRCERPEDVDDLYTQIRRYRIGKSVECEVLRQGRPVGFTLPIEEDLKTAEEPKRYKDEVFDLTVENLTELERMYRNIPPGLQGVKMAHCETGGWAQLAGLAGGDLLLAIDGITTADVDTAERLLKKAAQDRARRVVFFLRRGVHTRFAEVEPVWQPVAAEATETKHP
ncbi:MAG: PDZ domain-containing protein [Kiritimatiellaeota bacterium]|nr:PDZ domain-containing protein [Kiritimatiellota bacterium]